MVSSPVDSGFETRSVIDDPSLREAVNSTNSESVTPTRSRGDHSREGSVKKVLFKSIDPDPVSPSQSLSQLRTNTIIVDLMKNSEEGFGFNIVGGLDSPYFPGDNGIFVSRVKNDGPASKDGRIHEGDKLLSIDGIDLTNRTHDQVVAIFRKIENKMTRLLIDSGAEKRIVNEQHSPLYTSSRIYPSIVPEDPSTTSNSDYVTPSTPTITTSFADVATCSEDVTTAKERDEDSESVASFAPSMHSIIDDVPRTPKKQTLSVFDPRNQSIFTEALYVSIGLAVIGLGAMVAYRFIRGRR